MRTCSIKLSVWAFLGFMMACGNYSLGGKQSSTIANYGVKAEAQSSTISFDQSCSDDECGQRPLLPNYICSDGKTIAGPGPCNRFEDGVCRWTIVSCPTDSAGNSASFGG